MNAAVVENPTKNREFDVTLLLEKIVDDFQNLKSSVKSVVSKYLSFDKTILGITFKCNLHAEKAWLVIDKYGFSSIEKIITWFDAEEQQDRLTNIILNNDDLKTALNYGSQVDNVDLGYSAVARVGILIFTDYIHETYIMDGGWIQDLWVMGTDALDELGFSTSSTLVDVVVKIMDFVGSTLSTIATAVENAATNFVDGMKDGLSYVAEKAMELIIDGIVSLIKNALIGIKIMVNLISDDFDIIENSQGITVNGLDILVYRENLNFIIQLGNMKISLGNYIGNPEFEAETLSVFGTPLFGLRSDVVGLSHIVTMLASMLISTAVKSPTQAGALLIGTIIAQLFFFSGGTFNAIKDTNFLEEDRFIFRLQMFITYLGLAFSLALAYITIFKNPRNINLYLTGEAIIYSMLNLGTIVANLAITSFVGSDQLNLIGGFVSSIFDEIGLLLLSLRFIGSNAMANIRFLAQVHIGIFILFAVMTMFTSLD